MRSKNIKLAAPVGRTARGDAAACVRMLAFNDVDASLGMIVSVMPAYCTKSFWLTQDIVWASWRIWSVACIRPPRCRRRPNRSSSQNTIRLPDHVPSRPTTPVAENARTKDDNEDDWGGRPKPWP